MTADFPCLADGLLGTEMLFIDEHADGVEELAAASAEDMHLGKEIAPDVARDLDAQTVRQGAQQPVLFL